MKENRMKEGLMLTENTTLKAKAAWEQMLTMHNAKNPGGQLIDITDALDRARCARLHTLLKKRVRNPQYLDDFMADAPETATVLYNTLSLIAAIRVTHPKRRGVVWEEIEEAFKTRRATPAVNRAMERASRAMRLIDRLIAVGCVKRGEV